MIKKSKREIKYIVVHCTATRPAYDFHVKDVDAWHKNLGWKGIGYNYLIPLSGKLEFGRDVDDIPSHVLGFNENSIGLVYVGGIDDNMKPADTRNQEQKSSILSLLKELRKLYPKAIIRGHRDFPKVKKACPSFDAIKEYKGI
jgi:N-acetylmuramoyl-L-alanine amidase